MKTRKSLLQGTKIGNCIFLKDIDSKEYIDKKTKNILYKRRSLFECECGNNFEALLISVRDGNTKSCGCLKRKTSPQNGKSFITHGLSYHPLFLRWHNIKERCQNIKCKAYINYGARGISLCSRWEDLSLFIEDMYPSYIEGLEIDRIDNDGDYCPENCRWVTRIQNANNTRRNRFIEYNGMTQSVSKWANDLNMPYDNLLLRLKRWPIERVFTVPYPCPTKLRVKK